MVINVYIRVDRSGENFPKSILTIFMDGMTLKFYTQLKQFEENVQKVDSPWNGHFVGLFSSPSKLLKMQFSGYKD